MTITAALAADSRLLSAALDEPGTDIAHTLAQLAADTAAGVPSYLGLSVTATRRDPPFTSTYLLDGVGNGDVGTSLQLRLPGPRDSRRPPTVVIILYAATPGAFVDLAADLAWLTARPLADFALDRRPPPTDDRRPHPESRRAAGSSARQPGALTATRCPSSLMSFCGALRSAVG